jgi:hypothetical protein
MAKTKKQKNKYPITIPNSNSVLYGIVTVIIFSIVLYFLWGVYQEKREDTQRIEDLNKVGVILDEVKDKLKDSGVNARIERYSYCWRTGEKYSEGTRYCDQRLITIGQEKDQRAVQDEVFLLIESIRSLDIFTLKSDFPSGDYEYGLLLDSTPLQSIEPLKTKCNISLHAFSNEYDGRYKNSYVVDIICDSHISKGDIYPEKGRFSPLDLIIK